MIKRDDCLNLTALVIIGSSMGAFVGACWTVLFVL